MSLADLVKRRDDQKRVSLITTIDEILTEEDWEYRAGYHPSSMAYKLCPRQEALIQLEMLLPRKTISARLQRIFNQGHAFHDRMQSLVRKREGLVVEHERFGWHRKEDDDRGPLGEEVRLVHEVGISSRADNVLNLEKGYWDVVDWKGVNLRVFSPLVQAVDYHEKQLIVYLGLLNDLFEGEPPAKLRGRLLYECKDDQHLKEYVVPWGPEQKALYDGLLDLLREINEAVAQDDPSMVPCTCGSCPTDLEKLREKPKVVRV